MRQKLNLITLGVDDFETSVKFYEALGWKRSAASVDGLALFPLGCITLALHPRHDLAKDALADDHVRGFSGITISFNAHSQVEVDAVMQEAEAAGAKIVKPAQKVYWGGYSGYFSDPSGHLIEVAHNPFWELDENNNLKL
ncbi:VOC family protein [Pseudochryseolinea flava]|uniref:VOC family protein n=1 Tax=Pseudochryseolinea flava TaxID=2059302 RepID=A0A364Y863_9BACT|nr:VOC family protein [Pseudochryseolinea flava]RAW03306.1 VOC family protein [Pseudochryseolinea flava]